MITIKYIIVDDESVAHDIIKKYCSMLPNMQLMQNCYDAIEAIQFLNSNSVDLIFLDLNMPKLKGFEFLKTLPNPPKVIVTTAYKEFALDGYELNIVDYLLKPFPFERLLKAVNKAFAETTYSVKVSQNETDDLKGTSVFLQVNNKYIQVHPDDILFVEASGNYVKLILKEEIINIRGTLTSVMRLIPNKDFLQVHRSFIVARKHIKSIEGNQIFIDCYRVPIGKYYKSQIDALLK